MVVQRGVGGMGLQRVQVKRGQKKKSVFIDFKERGREREKERETPM